MLKIIQEESKDEDKAKKVIKDLQRNFSKDNASQLKAVELLKGLSLSDEDISNEFMKELDKAITEISKKVLKEK